MNTLYRSRMTTEWTAGSSIRPNKDGLTLNYSLITPELKQKLEELNIIHTDYADLNAVTNNLGNMMEAKKELRVDRS